LPLVVVVIERVVYTDQIIACSTADEKRRREFTT
jgi:hypothetical protein